MKKLKLYLETSVWNFCFADDAPEKKEATLQFFERVKDGKYKVYISEVVLTEISHASDEKKVMLFNLINDYNPAKLELTEEAILLAQKYLENGVPSSSCA